MLECRSWHDNIIFVCAGSDTAELPSMMIRSYIPSVFPPQLNSGGKGQWGIEGLLPAREMWQAHKSPISVEDVLTEEAEQWFRSLPSPSPKLI